MQHWLNFSKLERETGRQTDRQTESTIQFLLVFIPEMGGVANVIRQDQLEDQDQEERDRDNRSGNFGHSRDWEGWEGERRRYQKDYYIYL